MPRITKEQKIEALQEARRQLAKNPADYWDGICSCLPSTDAGYAMRAYISSALGSHGWLGGWLRINRPELQITPHVYADIKRLKKYRLQWIDWMIACLEGKNP